MSKYDGGWAEAYDDEYGDREWHRLTQTPFNEVNLHVHSHYLKRYGQPGRLDVGTHLGSVARKPGC